MNDLRSQLTVLHVFSGDLWAGAEVMIFHLLSKLKDCDKLRIIAISLNEGTLADKLKAKGIETFVIPEMAHSFTRMFFKAYKLIKGKKIDIIHSHRYKENLLALLLAKSLGVERLITTLHGLSEPSNRPKGQIQMSLRTRMDYFALNHFFTRVVAVSHEIKDLLIERYGFSDGKVEAIYNGIELPYSSSCPPPGSPNGVFHIGTVGRLVPVKDFGLFLDVAAEIMKQTDKVRFSILGSGPLKEQLIRKAKDLKIEEYVEFMSPITDPFSYYQSLDIYLSTSLHEGIPLSILEAMACGKPVVAPKVGGIPEIVCDEENGFLIEKRSPVSFAAVCLELVNNGAQRVRMGEACMKKAKDHFSSSRMAERYERLYLSL